MKNFASLAAMLACLAAAPLGAGRLDATVFVVGPCSGNATPAVRAAAERLRDGDTLRFAKGEYHFFEEGAKDRFLAVV